MKDYIYPVLCTSVLCGIIELFAPKKHGLYKYISFACALATVMILVYPLFCGSISFSFGGIDEISTKQLEERAEAQAVGENVARAFCAFSGVELNEVRAEVAVTDGEVAETVLYADTLMVADKKGAEEKLSASFGFSVKIVDKYG